MGPCRIVKNLQVVIAMKQCSRYMYIYSSKVNHYIFKLYFKSLNKHTLLKSSPLIH